MKTTQEIKNLILDQVEKWDRLKLKYTKATIVEWVVYKFGLTKPFAETIVEELIREQNE